MAAASPARKRTNTLFSAHQQLQDVQGALNGIDLRGLRGSPELKDWIVEARGNVEAAVEATGEALKQTA